MIEHTNLEKLGALVFVVVMASLGGIFVWLFGGFRIPKIRRFPGYYVRPLTKSFKLPPLIGMIVMGFVVRNLIEFVLNAYPSEWAQKIRSCILAVLLARSGLMLTLKGKGLMILYFVVAP